MGGTGLEPVTSCLYAGAETLGPGGMGILNGVSVALAAFWWRRLGWAAWKSLSGQSRMAASRMSMRASAYAWASASG